MAAIDDVRAADILKFADISYMLVLPGSGPIAQHTGPLCIRKDTPLSFTLTSEDLHLPCPGIPFTFTGVPGPDGMTVRWTIDQDLDVNCLGFHIHHVRGELLTSVVQLPPTLDSGCDMSERVFAAALTTTGGSNTIQMNANLAFVPVSASVTDIVTEARAGKRLDPLFLRVRIHADSLQHDGCRNHFLVQGGTVRLTALIEDLRTEGTLASTTFHWERVSGATVVGPTDQATLTLSLDATGTLAVSVSVAVTTSIQTGVGRGAVEIAVLTEEEANQMRRLCRLRDMIEATSAGLVTLARGAGAGFRVGNQRFVDPLWDPVPDMLRAGTILTRGSSLQELHRIHHTAGQVAKEATALVQQTHHLIGLHESLAKAAREVEALPTAPVINHDRPPRSKTSGRPGRGGPKAPNKPGQAGPKDPGKPGQRGPKKPR